MIRFIKLPRTVPLDVYGSIASLTGLVQELRVEAESVRSKLKGESLLVVNSTAQGGGVAEMLPRMLMMLQELGFDVRWAVIGSDHPEFFQLTKRLHNLIHGEGKPVLTPEEQGLYEEVSQTLAGELRPHLRPRDVLLVHDPQPLGAGAILKRQLGLRAIWRCHVGLDEHLPATQAAWSFLRPYAEEYDHAVFSAPEYIPDYLTGRASVIQPGIDPLGHKNRVLTPHKLTGVLCNAGLALAHSPVLTGPFTQQALRLQPDGSFARATQPEEIGLLFRTIVTQISRWDRLKGFEPLLEGFVRLKKELPDRAASLSTRHRRRLEIMRLVLAGPDPASIPDDPESCAVLDRLTTTYCALDPEIQKDIAILSLPMKSRKQNELMVNALQRCATVVVQNSLREGFGLTATEAMWKGTTVVGTRACGLAGQIRDGIDGRLIAHPEDPDNVAKVLDEVLADAHGRERYARSGQKRVHTEFLTFVQMRQWLRLMASQIAG